MRLRKLESSKANCTRTDVFSAVWENRMHGCEGSKHLPSPNHVFYDVKAMSAFISKNPALRKPTVVKVRRVTSTVPKRNVQLTDVSSHMLENRMHKCEASEN